MNIKDIFGLFGPSKDKKFTELSKEELDSWKETPQFKLGMFHKLVLNEDMFSKKMIKFFTNSNHKLNEENLEQAGEYIAYTRAWYWIKDCDLNELSWVEEFKGFRCMEFLVAIKLCISYFESIEDFEKCAFLKKIQSFIEDSLDT